MSQAPIVGNVLSAYGSIVQGEQTGDLLDNQANLQRRNATQAILAAKFNANRSQIMASKALGRMSSEYSAAGVSLNSGSVMSVMAESAANAELDRQNIIHQGDLRADNYMNQAALDELSAKHARTAGYFNAFSSIIAGGAKMYADSPDAKATQTTTGNIQTTPGATTAGGAADVGDDLSAVGEAVV